MNAAWALVSLPVALIATPIAAAVARRTGVVDRPGPLKIQQTPVPYLGGVAVFVAMAGPIAVVRPMLLVPLACLLALGLADDLGDLAPRLRLVCEVAIGAVGGAIVPVPGPFGAVVTAAFVVGLVNAVNLLDGLDGLAGGVVCASAIGFALIGGAARVPGIALAGALGGFLWYNRPPARIYLGDSGAYLCGGALALLAALALGARSALAHDIDPQALVATHDNAVRNGVESKLETVAEADALDARAARAVCGRFSVCPARSHAGIWTAGRR